MIDNKKFQQAFIFLVGIFLIVGWFYPAKNIPLTTVKQKSSEITFLVVPKLDIKAPIIFVESKNEGEIQKALENGVVHYFGTVKPGEIGNSYIVGHSSDYPQSLGLFKEVFSRLPEMQIGDNIIIQNQQKSLNFVIVDSKVVEAGDLSVLNQETLGRKLITLQTSYPVGTARQRFIVVAELNEK